MSGYTRFVEQVEPRRLLCASTPAATLMSSAADAATQASRAGSTAIHTTVAHVAARNLKLSLTGSVNGTYTVHQANPDTGPTYGFNASGKLKPLGGISAHGSVLSTGFIANGHSTGTLKVTVNSGGALTLYLTGPSQWGMTPVPDVFNFRITAGTGRYRKATGTGFIVLTRSPSPTAAAVIAGTFGMTFLKFAPP
jgi:hypothetical protein